MTLQLNATLRDSTKSVKQLRRTGVIPAVLYGHSVKPLTLAVPYMDFIKAYRAAGESTLVDVALEGGETRKVLIHDVQRDPLTEQLIHADFYEVRMTEKMKTKIPLRFIGEAPAVKQKGGLLVKTLPQILVECLPQDLVSEITVDITGLNDYGQSIYVKNIPAPKGVVILEKSEEPVVTVMRPKTDEELAKELAEETPKEKVEDVVKVQEKGKKEEEGAEGETKTADKAADKKAPPTKEAKK